MWRFGERDWELYPPSHISMHLFHLAVPKLACECAKSLQLCPTFATPWTVAHQAPLSMGFSRQEYWSGLPCPAPGDLPDPGIELTSLGSPALGGGFLTTAPPGRPSSLPRRYM